MTTAKFELRLVEDSLHSGAVLELPADKANRVVYVAHGSIDVGGTAFGDDSAWCGSGAARIVAGTTGAALWRFELVPTGAPLTAASASAGRLSGSVTRQKVRQGDAPRERAASSSVRSSWPQPASSARIM